MAKQFAIRLALIAFAASSIRGLFTGSEFEAAVKNALLTAFVFGCLGVICGELARRLIEEVIDTEFRESKESDNQNLQRATDIAEPVR